MSLDEITTAALKQFKIDMSKNGHQADENRSSIALAAAYDSLPKNRDSLVPLFVDNPSIEDSVPDLNHAYMSSLLSHPAGANAAVTFTGELAKAQSLDQACAMSIALHISKVILSKTAQ